MDIEKKIEEIEAKYKILVPYSGKCEGTIISRCLLAIDSNGKCFIGKNNDPQDLCWCVGFGITLLPKNFYYGRTIVEALEEAEKGLDKLLVENQGESL